MPPTLCQTCNTARAQILRPKNHARICAPCFITLFECEIASTITESQLFRPGEHIAIGASGGKDSTVLASVLKTLNDRHNWGLDLVLLSIDEGITGYRDHSLEAVKRHSKQYDLPLKIVSYADLYGWSMDQVVAQVGKKGNCTYCGVFRRQALDRGAAILGVGHVVTGHNADDVAETVLMNLLRGDLPRLSRATSIVTSTPSACKKNDKVSFTNVKRSKPLMYAYEKEIVLYAHHKKLDYFSTECIYSPEAFRGSARTLIKNLERIRPESILDIVRSGIDMAKLVPGVDNSMEEDGQEGCGNTKGGETAGEGFLSRLETEIKMPLLLKKKIEDGQRHDRDPTILSEGTDPSPTAPAVGGQDPSRNITSPPPPPNDPARSTRTIPIRTKDPKKSNCIPKRKNNKDDLPPKQKLGQCERCGYLSSQAVCKACMLLEGLNKARPRVEVGEVLGEGIDD